jgi:hypothetical protein
MSPWSPSIPHRARQKVLQGDYDGAIDLLTWHAENAFSTKTRNDSYWQAAQLASFKLEDKTRAIALLRQCLASENFDYLVPANAQLASLIRDKQPEIAIIHWKNAIELDPGNEKAGEWWLRIASTYEKLASTTDDEEQKKKFQELAIVAWNEVAEDKNKKNMAHLALGRLQLWNNPKNAKMHFQKAKVDSSTERSRSAEIGEQLADWELERLEERMK